MRCEQPAGNHPEHFAFDRDIWAYESWGNADYVDPTSTKPRPRAERHAELNEMVARVRERDRESGYAAALAESSRSAEARWGVAERTAVIEAIRRVALAHPTFTTDDVWRELADRVPVTKGMTAMLAEARRRGWIVSTGETVISRRGGEHDHAQRLTVWRSLLVTQPPPR